MGAASSKHAQVWCDVLGRCASSLCLTLHTTCRFSTTTARTCDGCTVRTNCTSDFELFPGEGCHVSLASLHQLPGEQHVFIEPFAPFTPRPCTHPFAAVITPRPSRALQPHRRTPPTPPRPPHPFPAPSPPPGHPERPRTYAPASAAPWHPRCQVQNLGDSAWGPYLQGGTMTVTGEP